MSSKIKIYFVLFHLLLGAFLYYYNIFSTYYGLAIVLIGTYYILEQPDLDSIFPVFFSAYFVGLEVFLRMTKASLFWEFGKYTIIYFMLLGLVRQSRNTNIYYPILFYFVLLLPAIIYVPMDSINEWRQYVSFNLSGPLCLTVTSIYLYKKIINKFLLGEILFIMILPIISISIYNILAMPDLATFKFLPHSNNFTSGGYGPNQVSTVFGLGISSILIAELLKIKMFKNKIINYSLFVTFLILGLLTFSRGGILSALIACSFAISYYYLYNQRIIYILTRGSSILLMTFITWNVVAHITDGVIAQRYGFDNSNNEEEYFFDSTGRAEIYSLDVKIFFDYFFTGVGLGQSKNIRQQYGYEKKVNAHTEFSRMLAEHGILGLLSLLIFCFILSKQLLGSSNPTVGYIKIFFGLLAVLNMSHAAMRLSMAPFIFGFIFPNYKDK